VVLLDGKTLAAKGEIEIDGNPLGVAWGGDVLYVGNDSTAAVDIYAPQRNGRWKVSGSLGGPSSPIPKPTDLAYDRYSGHLFVLSAGLKRVLVFGADGRLVTTIGVVDDSPSCLTQPTALAIDTLTEEVFVSDYGDSASGESAGVKIYGFDGSYLGAICGDAGQGGFEFSRPQGMALSSAGEILLADSLLGQVLVFDRTTLLGVASLGSYGTAPGQLLLPLDVALDAEDGRVVVTNNRAGRLEVLTPEVEP
jgi:DNA-binding beta-propeller fold protein YncE